MKIVVAPDSFKECLDAREVASAISEGVLAVFPEASVISIPLSDGGEGMAAILAGRLGGQMVKVPVTGPMGPPSWMWLRLAVLPTCLLPGGTPWQHLPKESENSLLQL